MANEGWIKLSRSLLLHPIFKTPVVGHFWVYLLLKANHEAVRVKSGKRFMTIDRGELLLSIRGCQEECGVTPRQVRTCLNLLKNDTMIDTRCDTLGTVVTIVNYDDYQAIKKKRDTPSDTPSDTRATHERHTSDTRATHDFTNQNRVTVEAQGPTSIIDLHSQEPKNERMEEPEKLSAQIQRDVPRAANDLESLCAQYVGTLQRRYQMLRPPDVTGKMRREMKVLLNDHGYERASEYVAAFLEMTDAHFCQRHHELDLLLSSRNKVASFIETGRALTTTAARRLEVVSESMAAGERWLKRMEDAGK